NGYGICTGKMSPRFDDMDQANFEGLTNWMHRHVQTVAGRAICDPPLTFGELWNPPSKQQLLATHPDPTAPRVIELAMIASDISRNRTAQIPFLETPSPLYIEMSILNSYFPNSIVKWMKENAGEYDDSVEGRADVIRLPKPQNLP